jgi:hypothetical protein
MRVGRIKRVSQHKILFFLAAFVILRTHACVSITEGTGGHNASGDHFFIANSQQWR